MLRRLQSRWETPEAARLLDRGCRLCAPCLLVLVYPGMALAHLWLQIGKSYPFFLFAPATFARIGRRGKERSKSQDRILTEGLSSCTASSRRRFLPPPLPLPLELGLGLSGNSKPSSCTSSVEHLSLFGRWFLFFGARPRPCLGGLPNGLPRL